MKNKVSVVIPVYNGEKTLRQCLSSLLNQTFRKYEIIVVDNNSKDRTPLILNEYQDNSKIPFQVIFEPYLSRSTARNAGIKAAKGNIIICSDCDCIFPDDWIEKLTEPIRKEKEMAVQGGEEPAIVNFWTKQYQISFDNDSKELRKGNVNYIDTKNFAVLKKVLLNLRDKFGIFNPKMIYSDDLEFGMRFFAKGFKVKYLPECGVKHYHPDSLIKVIRGNFWKGYYTASIYSKIKKQDNLANAPVFSANNNFISSFLPWEACSRIYNKKSFSRLIYSLIQSASEKIGMVLAHII